MKRILFLFILLTSCSPIDTTINNVCANEDTLQFTIGKDTVWIELEEHQDLYFFNHKNKEYNLRFFRNHCEWTDSLDYKCSNYVVFNDELIITKPK